MDDTIDQHTSRVRMAGSFFTKGLHKLYTEVPTSKISGESRSISIISAISWKSASPPARVEASTKSCWPRKLQSGISHCDPAFGGRGPRDCCLLGPWASRCVSSTAIGKVRFRVASLFCKSELLRRSNKHVEDVWRCMGFQVNTRGATAVTQSTHGAAVALSRCAGFDSRRLPRTSNVVLFWIVYYNP